MGPVDQLLQRGKALIFEAEVRARTESDRIKVDSIHDLPRIIKVVGTVSRKGEPTDERPHRLSAALDGFERTDGAEERLTELIGPVIYRRDIQDLRGVYLASYETARLRVELAPDERLLHDRARALYRGFVERNGIAMSSAKGWGQFLQLAARSPEGRLALRAWRQQRQVALRCRAKLEVLENLLAHHKDDPTIIFTADNDTVHHISRTWLVPALTHETPGPERKRVLDDFISGRVRAIVTARILNEGVDLPSAQVGIVLSGSATVREHVQRLGRLLRKQGDKQAVLYEVITADTAEESVSERRREHGAYR